MGWCGRGDSNFHGGYPPAHSTPRAYQLRRYSYQRAGQRIAYAMLHLKRRDLDIRSFVHGLEEWAIQTLAQFGVAGERRAGRVGIWVAVGRHEDKIAALAVR